MSRILMFIIIALCAMPFIAASLKIEWVTYFALPLVIMTGSTGIAFIIKRYEAIIGGMVISALSVVLVELIKPV